MTAATHFHLFDTPIGVCALIWRGEVLVGAQLPERDEDAARARIARRFPDASESEADGFVKHAVADIRALLSGQPRDLSHLPVELSAVSEFNRRVYEIALAIPPGETLTYGEVAKKLGDPGASRAVGVALGQNPWPIVVPCHRVLASGGQYFIQFKDGLVDESGTITDEKTRAFLQGFVDGIAKTAGKLAA